MYLKGFTSQRKNEGPFEALSVRKQKGRMCWATDPPACPHKLQELCSGLAGLLCQQLCSLGLVSLESWCSGNPSCKSALVFHADAACMLSGRWATLFFEFWSITMQGVHVLCTVIHCLAHCTQTYFWEYPKGDIDSCKGRKCLCLWCVYQ